MHAEFRSREVDPRRLSDAKAAPHGHFGDGQAWRVVRGLECGSMDGSGCGRTPLDEAPPDGQAVPGTVAESGIAHANRARIAGELYVAHYHKVYAFVRKFLDEAEAEEVAHESFVRLLKVRELERMSISVAYLFRIAENLLRRRYERAQRYRAILERLGRVAPWAFEDSDAGSGQIVARRGVEESADGAGSGRLEAAFEHLTSSEQSAVRLIVCEGLDYHAAARSLGVPVSTVNNWKHRGIAKLRRLVASPLASERSCPSRAVG